MEVLIKFTVIILLMLIFAIVKALVSVPRIAKTKQDKEILKAIKKGNINSYVQEQWDNKSNDSILASLEDANEWIRLSEGMFKSETMTEIADECRDRLSKYILPQMEKRGLS